ncbi:MAG TPA: ABC transporter permease [Acidimicrobiales bacterium]|nr:ABC transporter permease [Acidimicrobiales bacterium]
MTDLRSEASPEQSESGSGEPGVGQATSVRTRDATYLMDERRRELEARVERAAARGVKTSRVVAARVSIWRRLREVWRSRELFVFLVRKEIKVKYKNSFLGFLWSMLNPAMTLAVFYVLFTFFLPNHIPNFVIYMFSAMLVWNLFQTAVLTGTSTIVANGGIVKKVAFPREILAFASVGSAFMFFLFQSIVLLAFMFAFWHRPDWGAIWILIPALAAIVLFAAALSVFLGAVNVYLRDTQHLVEVALMAWFWATPGIYAFSGTVHQGLIRHRIFEIPGTHLIWLYFANPVTPIVMTFQRVFYNVTKPLSTLPTKLASGKIVHLPIPHGVMAHYGIHWYVLSDLVILAVSLFLLLGGLVVFGRLEGNFAEEL